MNDFYWGDFDDQEIEAIHSDLLSIHEAMGKSCPSSAEQTVKAVFCQYDTDRTNNELESLDGERHIRQINLAEEISSDTQTNSSKRSLLSDLPGDLPKEDQEESSPKKKRTRSRKRRNLDELSLLSYNQELSEITAEYELNQFIHSPTDPVGKFLRKLNLTAKEAIELGIHKMLLQCPRKIREKYGPRKEWDEIDRMVTNRERNREHARATRQRRKIFKQVEEALFESGYKE